MIQDTYVRKATVRRIIDGDTIEVLVDCGFRRFSVETLRILGVDTPEVRGASKQEGLISKAFVAETIPVGSEVVLKSQKSDSFGRWLAEVFYEESEGVYLNLAEVLIEKGLGIVYED